MRHFEKWVIVVALCGISGLGWAEVKPIDPSTCKNFLDPQDTKALVSALDNYKTSATLINGQYVFCFKQEIPLSVTAGLVLQPASENSVVVYGLKIQANIEKEKMFPAEWAGKTLLAISGNNILLQDIQLTGPGPEATGSTGLVLNGTGHAIINSNISGFQNGIQASGGQSTFQYFSLVGTGGAVADSAGLQLSGEGYQVKDGSIKGFQNGIQADGQDGVLQNLTLAGPGSGTAGSTGVVLNGKGYGFIASSISGFQNGVNATSDTVTLTNLTIAGLGDSITGGTGLQLTGLGIQVFGSTITGFKTGTLSKGDQLSVVGSTFKEVWRAIDTVGNNSTLQKNTLTGSGFASVGSVGLQLAGFGHQVGGNTITQFETGVVAGCVTATSSGLPPHPDPLPEGEGDHAAMDPHAAVDPHVATDPHAAGESGLPPHPSPLPEGEGASASCTIGPNNTVEQVKVGVKLPSTAQDVTITKNNIRTIDDETTTAKKILLSTGANGGIKPPTFSIDSHNPTIWKTLSEDGKFVTEIGGKLTKNETIELFEHYEKKQIDGSYKWTDDFRVICETQMQRGTWEFVCAGLKINAQTGKIFVDRTDSTATSAMTMWIDVTKIPKRTSAIIPGQVVATESGALGETSHPLPSGGQDNMPVAQNDGGDVQIDGLSITENDGGTTAPLIVGGGDLQVVIVGDSSPAAQNDNIEKPLYVEEAYEEGVGATDSGSGTAAMAGDGGIIGGDAAPAATGASAGCGGQLMPGVPAAPSVFLWWLVPVATFWYKRKGK